MMLPKSMGQMGAHIMVHIVQTLLTHNPSKLMLILMVLLGPQKQISLVGGVPQELVVMQMLLQL